MENKIYACADSKCPRYLRRFYNFKFCGHCGKKLQAIVVCCEMDDLNENGFCVWCGMKKETRVGHIFKYERAMDFKD